MTCSQRDLWVQALKSVITQLNEKKLEKLQQKKAPQKAAPLPVPVSGASTGGQRGMAI